MGRGLRYFPNKRLYQFLYERFKIFVKTMFPPNLRYMFDVIFFLKKKKVFLWETVWEGGWWEVEFTKVFSTYGRKPGDFFTSTSKRRKKQYSIKLEYYKGLKI